MATLTISPTPVAENPLHRLWRRCAMLFAAIADAHEEESVSADRRLSLQYEAAVRDYSSLIDRICFGYAKSVDDLADLRQDTLLNLWESMKAYRGDCAMKTWVYRLTLNTCVSSLRKSSRRVTTVQLSELYDTIDYDADRKSLIAELHEAIGRLNPIDKAIMLLWLEEEPYDTIATITGVSKSNVATRIHRAKERLRSILNR